MKAGRFFEYPVRAEIASKPYNFYQTYEVSELIFSSV